jgi:pyruvate,water dikinase
LDSGFSLLPHHVGAKAARLAALRQQKLPVPDGFCITTEACRRVGIESLESLESLVVSRVACFGHDTSLIVRLSTGEGESDTLPRRSDSSACVTAAAGVIAALAAFLRATAQPLSPFIRHLHGTTGHRHVAILVQRALQGEFCGVAFRADPTTGPEETLIAARDCGPNSTPTLYSVSRGGATVQRETLGNSSISVPQESLAELSRLTRRAADVLGYPCEIGWMLAAGTLWIVRVRPMSSAAGREKSWDRWTRANIREVVPERLTPLSYCAWREPMELLFRNSFRYYKLPTEDYQFIKNNAGGLWYNIGVINHLAAMLGVPPIDLAIGTAEAILGTSHAGIRPWRLFRHLLGHARAVSTHMRLGSTVQRATVTLRELAATYSQLGERAISARECLDVAGECYAQIKPFLKTYSDTTSAAFVTLALLDLASKRWLTDFNIGTLLSADGAEVAAAGEALLALRQNPQSAEALNAFLERFGHRGWQEVELMSSTWRDIDRDWMTLAITPNPPRAKPPPPAVQIPPELRGWRRGVFLELTERARQYATLRENIKHEFFRPIDTIRRLLRKAGRLLSAAGLTDSEEAIYFLTTGELDDLVSGSRVTELRARAQLRRIVWDHAVRTPIPEEVPHTESQVSRWHGLGASGGKAAGPARVLRSPYGISNVRPGDILVAEALDVGWFPLFPVVGGLVTALGGLLSHPCTVAREQGLPAVVGIPNVMDLIPEGSWLVIDGDRGTVEMRLPPEADAQRPRT